jgi:hypothetical protein
LDHSSALSDAYFLTREFFFTKNNMTVIPYPLVFSLFVRLKMKLKGRHFGTIEVIKAELQMMLITFTEHKLQDAFKNWQKHWEWCIRVEGDYVEVDTGQ